MKKYYISFLLISLLAASYVQAENKEVGITRDLKSVEVTHNGTKVTIMRNQDNENLISNDYAKTSRPCPPFCIKPIKLAPGVETIGELEMLHYLGQKEAGDHTIVVIDSRTPKWFEKGTIPGAINLPWTELSPAQGADPLSIAEILIEYYGVKQNEDLFDFSEAKTAVMFCNGMWCGQSPANIKTLLKFGYPAHKIKWYRGGMQDWEVLGLTTVK